MQPTDEHGHVAVFYGSQQGRTQMLAQYFRDGLEKGELGVFVTPDPQQKVIEAFGKAGFDVVEYVTKGAFYIFEMTGTYMPRGKFGANYMLKNVANYIKDAKTYGYTGLRTAGEMSWLHDHPEAWAEAFAYEDMVNVLGGEHPEFTGICLYPVNSDSDAVLQGAVRTHPSLLYQGKLRHNSLFGSSELGSMADSDIKDLLASMD